MEFVCGPRLRNCAAAYRDWLATLEKNFQQLKTDGSENKLEDVNNNLGYNRDNIKSQVALAEKNLGLFSQALRSALAA